MRVAEPGTVITPPSTFSSTAEPSTGRPASAESSSQSEAEHEDDERELAAEPEFNPEQCLFCDAENESFDDNILHMSKAHSFVIPHQDSLTIDSETLIGYLHLIINGYGECILCATRRGTVQGIQHHMVAKGHCRFNVTSDMAEFYKMPEQDYHADEESLRLPSGRLLRNRARTAGPATFRSARQSGERRLEPTTRPATRTQDTDLVSTQDENPTPASCAQLSRLTRGDQQSLAHLPGHELRSLLATSARDIAHSRREETNAKLRLERAGNITLFAHFRADTSKRFRGPWG